MFIDIRAKLDFLDLNDFLLFPRQISAFLRFVFELAIVENLTYRRLNIRLNFDQIEASIKRLTQRISGIYNAKLFAIVINTTYGGIRNSFVNTRAIAL